MAIHVMSDDATPLLNKTTSVGGNDQPTVPNYRQKWNFCFTPCAVVIRSQLRRLP
jgi:hypothetical protein